MSASRLSPEKTFLPRPGSPPVEWAIAPGFVGYERAVAEMEARADAIAAGEANERVWLIEHPPLYTAGTSAKDADLRDPRFPVFKSGRGGQYTYHGPGQRVVYPMLDLKRRRQDLRAYVGSLEAWIIDVLAAFGVMGETRCDRVGVWVPRAREPGSEDKIAAIGVRVRRWASFHGLALNVAPNLSHFEGIVPCGISEARYGVTSLSDLGVSALMRDVDTVLRRTFEVRFGATAT